MKKKLLSALLCVAMVASMLVGCGGSKEAATDAPAAETDAPAAEAADGASKGSQWWVIVIRDFSVSSKWRNWHVPSFLSCLRSCCLF